jgi:hypothetical protein
MVDCIQGFYSGAQGGIRLFDGLGLIPCYHGFL